MKVIKCYIDKNCQVKINNVEEIEMDMDVIMENLRHGDTFDGYLFLPSDKPNVGSPIDANVSREVYLTDPAKYGVCVYKTWSGKVVFE